MTISKENPKIKNKNRRYGWKPDQPDHRDYKFIPRFKGAVIQSVDLRIAGVKGSNGVPPIVDQGQLGSCTGNAIAGAVGYDLMQKSPASFFQPSRLFIYYNERVIEGSVNEDAGAEIRDGIKTVVDKGVCHETLWPYDISKFTNKPSSKSYTDAKKYKALSYQRIDNTSKGAMVGALLGGQPFVFGFSVYESFESDKVARTGVVPMPGKSESLLGGHAVYCVGYIKSSDRFIVANSWGVDWGNKGFFTIPAKYLMNTNMADDFWVINTLI